MATIRGCFGVVKIGPTPTVVAELRAWELNETAERIDVSAMGDCTKKFSVGAVEGSGTFSMWLDSGPDAGQALVVVGTAVDVELFPGGEGTGNLLRSFNATITDRGEAADVNGIVELSASYAVNGAIDLTPAP